MKRLLRISLLLLGGIAILATQPWFTVDLETGNSVVVSGFEALPLIGSALLANALAIALVLYVHKRWSLIFLLTALIAVLLALVLSVPSVLFGDLSILAPFVERATGIATWVAQLETVIVSKAAIGLGPMAWVLMLGLVAMQIWTLVQALRKWQFKPVGKKASKSNRTKDSVSTARNTDLWAETSSTAD